MAIRTIYDVQRMVRQYHETHGVRPTCKDFRTFDRWLRLNGSSINLMCDDMGLPRRSRERGRRHDGRTLETTEAEILAFYQEQGKRPTSADLSTLDTWLHDRHDSSVSRVCQRLGLPGGQIRGRTMDSARAEISNFYDEHGRRPIKRDMVNLDSWLWMHHRLSIHRVSNELELPKHTMVKSVIRQNVYWNLHKDLFSLQERGRVIGHAPTFAVENVRFNVGPRGAALVVKTGVKNVHAKVSGFACDIPADVDGWTRVFYNPTRGPFFTDRNGNPCKTANRVVGYEVDGKPQLFAESPQP
jgi:hypothetical protein